VSDTTGRTLLVLAAKPGGISPDTPILGLPLARRTALAASRAGFARVVFERAPGGVLEPVLAGTGAEIAEPGTYSTGGSGRTVVLASGILATVSGLAAAAAGGAERVSSPTFEVRGPEDVPAAERWLLQSMIKDDEGFMSRHVERRISLAISRRLAATRVTPNAMTLVSVGVGLAGAALFASTRPGAPFLGALLFLLHSILDGCDGELARLKFQESRFGGVLDFWGDNVVHSAVFAGIAIGWTRSVGALWPIAAGAAAIAGTLLSAGFVYLRAMGGKAAHEPQFTSVSRGPATRLSRLAGALARRDFIYLVVLLAAFGKAHWFLALAAVGAPIFFLVLVVIDASGRRLGRSFS
jgi:phosphatidylglycerophosphate synthase